MKNFLEKNYKWISSALLLIGMYLIIKLFWFGANTVCSGGGGYISLCIVPHIEYSWTYAGYISLLFLILSIVGIYLIKSTNNKLSKIYISIFVLLLGIIGKPLFYELSDDFKFFHNGSSQYTDKEGNLTNMDLYLESMGKYCDDSIDDFKFKNVYRRDMCGGQYITEFITAEEYAKALDYANKKNMWYMYKLTYRGAEKFGLEKIINVYHDDSFYAYVIKKRLLKDNVIKSLKLNINNEKLINLLNYYIKSLKEVQDSLKLNNEIDISSYWDNYDKYFNEKLKNIPEINQKIF